VLALFLSAEYAVATPPYLDNFSLIYYTFALDFAHSSAGNVSSPRIA